ncbi:MAG: hypothetical protein WB495_12140, partial [Xanthobacteraceae bacterium]
MSADPEALAKLARRCRISRALNPRLSTLGHQVTQFVEVFLVSQAQVRKQIIVGAVSSRSQSALRAL